MLNGTAFQQWIDCIPNVTTMNATGSIPLLDRVSEGQRGAFLCFSQARVDEFT